MARRDRTSSSTSSIAIPAAQTTPITHDTTTAPTTCPAVSDASHNEAPESARTETTSMEEEGMSTNTVEINRPVLFQGPPMQLPGGDRNSLTTGGFASVTAVQSSTENGTNPGDEATTSTTPSHPVTSPSDITMDCTSESGDHPGAIAFGPLTKPDMLALPGPTGSCADADSAHDDNGHRYVGLVNQAMTCYLNSLIQTLYMTPEFRNAIYDWEFAGSAGEESKNIPCQLQKLFLLLQTSERESLETKDLTASFGWNSSEAYDQHDVQELCRLMFDALEHRWKRTKNSSLIQDLYRGTMQDFVKCLECERENIKQDVFLDLPLAVKQFGAKEAFKSVEEALSAFVRPEVLDGANQYFCEQCNAKRDAHKGLRITHFPYMLTIQLKRFDFDYNTLHRIKLNDRMSFPDLLNLNEFVDQSSIDRTATTVSSSSSTSTHTTTCASKSQTKTNAQQSQSPKAFSYASAVGSKRKSDGASTSNAAGDNHVAPTACSTSSSTALVDSADVVAALASGPYVYELFSVMVHQGSAAGGHYFAYIRNLDQDRWFCFNDSSVYAASSEDIHRTFGGTSGGWATSNTNAYMLMYRQVDRVRNARFVKTANLPAHLVQLRERWASEDEQRRQMKIYQDSLVIVNARFNGPESCIPDASDVEWKEQMANTTRLSEVFDRLFVHFNAIAKTPLERELCRIVKCSSYRNELVESFAPSDMKKKTLLDAFLNISSSMYRPEITVIFDTRPAKSSAFAYIAPNCAGMSKTILVCPVNLDTNRIERGRLVWFRNTTTIKNVRKQLADLLGDVKQWNRMRLVLDGPRSGQSDGLIYLAVDDQTIEQVTKDMYSSITMFVDVCASGTQGESDRGIANFYETRMHALIERKKYETILLIRLPTLGELHATALPMSSELPGGNTIMSGGSGTESTSIISSCPPPSASVATATCGGGVHSSVPSSSSVMSNASSRRNVDAGGGGVQGAIIDGDSRSRQSPSSSISDDDDDGIALGSSPLNTLHNTPAVSPCVSDAEEQDMKEAISRSKLEGLPDWNKLNFTGEMDRAGGTSPNAMDDGATTTGGSSSGETITASGQPAGERPRAYHVAVIEEKQGEPMQRSVLLNVDKRMLVTELRQWLAVYLSRDPAHLIFKKQYAEGGEEFDYVVKDTDRVENHLATASVIRVKLGVMLRENEKMVKVMRFCINEPEDKWQQLFEVPVSSDTLGSTLLDTCSDLLMRTCRLEIDRDRLRLREVLNGKGVPILRARNTLDNRQSNMWFKDILLQIIADDEASVTPDDDDLCHVFIRRWIASTLELLPVREVAFANGNRTDHVLALREAIAAFTSIPLERIELSEAFPSTAWAKYPYMKNRLELLEQVGFSANALSPLDGYEGKLVYFRDSAEEPKRLTEEERRAVRIQDSTAACNQQASSSAAARRRERPLRIQMSTSLNETDPDALD